MNTGIITILEFLTSIQQPKKNLNIRYHFHHHRENDKVKRAQWRERRCQATLSEPGSKSSPTRFFLLVSRLQRNKRLESWGVVLFIHRHQLKLVTHSAAPLTSLTLPLLLPSSASFSLTHWYHIGRQYKPIDKLQVSGNAKRAIVKSVLPPLLLSWVVARGGMCVAAGG